MRKKVNIQPSFMFATTETDLKVVNEYQQKYTKIDELLEKNSAILDLAHKDLQHFSVGQGRDSAYSTEQILRMLMIKGIEQWPWRKLVIRIWQSDFLRNFARIGVGPVMDFTFLSRANKYLSVRTWKKINQTLFSVNRDAKKLSGEKLRVDSTVYESNIHFPTDAHLLWDSYRVITNIIRNCNEEYPHLNMGNRFHLRKAKELYTFIATHGRHKNNRTKRKIKRNYRKLIGKVEWIAGIGRDYLLHARSLGEKNYYLDQIDNYLPLIEQVLSQSRRRVLEGESVPVAEKIFSIFEPHTELLMRGKARKPLEFGHLVTIAQNGEKFITYYDVKEKSEADKDKTDEVINHHKRQFGVYPTKFAADKNYYKSMEHVTAWEEEIETFSVCKKGRRNQAEWEREHEEEFVDGQRFRAGSEGTISVLKRGFGMARCLFKSFKTFAASVGLFVFCHNLVLLARL